MTINCRSIKDKKTEFASCINYIKPDIICGTESWLKGIQPGKHTKQDAIKSPEIFPCNYKVYRNDLGTIGGGVFVAVHEDIISSEKPELVTECEIEWVKIKLRNNKDLYVSAFYMPHRNLTDIENLTSSLEKLNSGRQKHIILAGDFNCPDIDWKNLSVNTDATDKEVQQNLIDTTSEHGLNQIHDKPTRDDNILDLVFTNNPPLIKSSRNAPGISDHDIIITDAITKPHYCKHAKAKEEIYLLKNKLG